MLPLIRPFISSFFFLSIFQTLKFFVTLFSGAVRSGRLIRNQAAADYLSPYSVFFLSNFQTLKCFIALFSGTVRPIKLKLDTHVDNGWMYRVYRNQAAASFCPLFLYFLFSPMLKK